MSTFAPPPTPIEQLAVKFPSGLPPPYWYQDDHNLSDQAGWVYCPLNGFVYLLGGGHAATPRNSLLYIDPLNLELGWQVAHPGVSLAAMSARATPSDAIQYTARTWAVGDKMIPNAADASTQSSYARNWYYEVITGGTTDATNPTWTSFLGTTASPRHPATGLGGTTFTHQGVVFLVRSRHTALTDSRWWRDPAIGDASLSPPSQHTYGHGLLWSSAIQKLVKVNYNNGGSYGLPTITNYDATVESMGAFDPVTGLWEDWRIGTMGAAAAYIEDPVSGNLLSVHGTNGYRVFDPRTRTTLRKSGAVTWAGYSDAIVYFPPTDKFYLVCATQDDYDDNGNRNGRVPVVELTLNRSTWVLTPTQRTLPTGKVIYFMKTNPHPPRSGRGECQYEYNPLTQQIEGGSSFADKKYKAFKPAGDGTGTWFEQPTGSLYPNGLLWHFLTWCDNIQAFAVLYHKDATNTVTGGDGYILRPDADAWVKTVDPGTDAILNDGAYGTLQQAFDNTLNIVVKSGPTPPGNINGGANQAVGRKTTITCGTPASGRPLLDGPAVNNKGNIVMNDDLSVDFMSFRNSSVPDGNGAGIRHQAGNLTITNCEFTNNQNGILGPATPNPYTVSLTDSDFWNNGRSFTGQTHGIYIGHSAQLNVTRCRFWNNHIGHHLKSRAAQTTITDCELGLDIGSHDESYNYDCAEGGVSMMTGTTLRKWSDTDNTNTIFCNIGGGDTAQGNNWDGGSWEANGCTFVNNSFRAGRVVRNFIPWLVPKLQNCEFTGSYVSGFVEHAEGAAFNFYELINCTNNGVLIPDVHKLPPAGRPAPTITNFTAGPVGATGGQTVTINADVTECDKLYLVLVDGTTFTVVEKTPPAGGTGHVTTTTTMGGGRKFRLVAQNTTNQAVVTIGLNASTGGSTDTTPPPDPTQPLSPSYVWVGNAHVVTLAGTASAATDMAAVRLYVGGQILMEVTAAANQAFNAVFRYKPTGTLNVSYSFVDSSGNESGKFTQTVTVPAVPGLGGGFGVMSNRITLF